jgi:hypothetical protein
MINPTKFRVLPTEYRMVASVASHNPNKKWMGFDQGQMDITSDNVARIQGCRLGLVPDVPVFWAPDFDEIQC